MFYILTTPVLQVVSGNSLKCPQEGSVMTVDVPFLPESFNSEAEVCQAVTEEFWLFSEKWSPFLTRKWSLLKISPLLLFLIKENAGMMVL